VEQVRRRAVTTVELGAEDGRDRVNAARAARIVRVLRRRPGASPARRRRTGDEGVHAYDAFTTDTRAYLATLEPDAQARGEEVDPSVAEANVRLTATLPGGRRVRVDVLSTSSSLRADTAVDGWYGARSADADVILYSRRPGSGTTLAHS
jgi:hypothetical protein